MQAVLQSASADGFPLAPRWRARMEAAGVASGRPFGGVDQFSPPSTDARGRYVLFGSTTDGIVAGDRDGLPDLFRKDLATGRVDWVSGAVDGPASAGDLSADGKFVAFAADRTYVRDMASGATIVVDGTRPGGVSAPAVSDDGMVVAFVGEGGVQVADRRTGTVRTAGAGTMLDLTPDGRWLVFVERDDTTSRIVRLDLATGERTTVHAVPAGPGSGIVLPSADADASVISFTVVSNTFANYDAMIWDSGTVTPIGTTPVSTGGRVSGDGTRVLVGGAAGPDAVTGHLAVLDRATGTMTPVGDVDGAWAASLSRNGRAVAWATSSGLVAADGNDGPDVYARRLKAADTRG